MNQHLNIACFAVDGCLRQTEDFIVVKDALMTRIWNEDESAMKHSLKKFVLYVALNLRQGAKTRYIVQTLANKLHTEKNMLPLTVLMNSHKRITVTKGMEIFPQRITVTKKALLTAANSRSASAAPQTRGNACPYSITMKGETQ